MEKSLTSTQDFLMIVKMFLAINITMVMSVYST